ncbi:MAG: isoprenylcysteine carboxylmethyltransferase family protein [Aquabacterium sp.]
MELAAPLAFKLPYAAAFWAVAVWGYAMESLQIKRKMSRSAGHDGADRYSGLVISVGNGGLQLLAFIASFYVPWQDPAQQMPMFAAGLALIVAGMLLRMHCWRVLGAFFTHTVTIADDHRVVDQGAYKWLRHPSYLGALMTLGGLGVALGSQVLATMLLLGSLAIYVYRIEVEEAALESALGESYARFKQSRKRLIPFVY